MLLVVILLFCFSLPLLLQINTVKASGRPFTQHDWFDVIVGEILVAVILVIGWISAKRKYEKTSGD